MAFNKKSNVVKYFISCIAFLLPFLFSSSVFADSLGTAGFDLNYIPVSSNSYTWRNGMLFNQSQQVYRARVFQFNTSSISATGTNAVIHFETNVVGSQPAYPSGINQSHFTNLDYINIISCTASNGNLSILGSSISYARTPWFSNNNQTFNETLTLYGDVALKGFNKDTSGTIVCSIGNTDFAFYDTGSQIALNHNLYFEQNPMSIIWTDNNTDNLLQQQISQTQQLIYQNQQLYNQSEQNTQDIIDNQNQNAQDIIRSNQNCRNSYNIFNGNLQVGLINGDTGQNLDRTGFVRSTDYIPVQALSYYSFSSDDYSGPWYIYEYTSNYTYNLTANKYSTNGTFQTDSGTSYVRFRTAAFSNTNAKIMLVQGSSPKPYEAYNTEICKNVNQEYYDEQREADNNISNQSTGDIDNATNAKTNSLIGTISSFVSALGSIQTGSCELTLPFPNFVGGNTVVNPCTGKEKAPTLIAAASSMLLIGVFIPLAFIVLKMIYNEIKGFTNG